MRRPSIALAAFIVALVSSNPVDAANRTHIDGIGFSGSALMFLYHVGVLSELTAPHGEHPAIYKMGKTKVAGASGGSYIALLSTTGTSWAKIYARLHSMFYEIISDEDACLAENKTQSECNVALTGQLSKYGRPLLNDLLSNSSKQRKRANGRSFVSITLRNVTDDPTCSKAYDNNLTVSEYRSRSDMLNALFASSFYSFVMEPKCTTTYRNMTVRDGGYAYHMPCPPDSTSCLMVEANIIPSYPYGQCGGGDSEPTRAARDPDIYPGLSGPLPAAIPDQCTWFQATLNPQMIYDNWFDIFYLAKADAVAWLENNGWA